MKVCPKCGRENPDDRDFCECGEYLRWDPTQFIRAAPSDENVGDTAEQGPAAGPTGTKPMPAPRARGAIDPVTIELEAPEGSSSPGGVAATRARPGETGVLKAKVRNQSGIVDNYELRVEGLDPGWWSTSPETVYLVPFGSAGTYEDEIEIRFHPPRSADAEARSWDLEIVVVSKAARGRVAAAEAKLVVDPFEDVEADVRPQRRQARFGARFALALTNRANSPLELELDATDRDQAMRYRFARPRVELGPGERKPNRLTVRPRRQRWFGQSVEHPVEIVATPVGGEEPVVTREATFVQRPWIPRWLAIAAPIVLAFALMVWLLLPSNATVPDITGQANLFEAQKLLDEAKLKLASQAEEQVVSGERIGAILDQTPPAGETVEEGSEVTVQVGVGSGTVEAPDLAGMSLADADSALREEDLTLGAVQPQPEDPAAAEITSQLPAAGEEVQVGSPVNVFVAGGGEGGDGGGGDGEGAVPSVEGLSGAEAAAALAEAGLAPVTVSVVDDSEPGTLVGTEPPEGAELPPGSAVRVLISAGFPEVAITDDEDVIVLRGTSGEEVSTVADTDELEEQPAWTPDGTRIAFRRDGVIVLADPDGGDARQITPDGEDFHVPSFAPTEGRLVLAAIRRDGDAGDLCLMRVPGSGEATPRCIADPEFDLGRQLSWAPDGRSLLAFAVDTSDEERFGLRLYTSRRPFSARPEDWDEGEMVTDLSTSGRGVISGAFSPDGERLAVVSNLGGGPVFRVFLAGRNDFELEDAEPLGVRGCEVEWRTDGLELLVTQRDAGCQETSSELTRIDPRSPEVPNRLGSGVASPAWQPLDVDR
ncbi:MAG TPA: PASTA domain-containing protein [Solirubrobacterales bacterium]|nr:PASTA domain-containing protein [Solirubrobacterales bacterium]